MFTGIVEEAGRVLEARSDADGRRLRVACDEVGEELHHGQSIAVSGVCLTVEEYGDLADPEALPDGEAGRWFEVFLAAETVDRTYLDQVTPGDLVNLERAMPADGRLDGHVVQGHVDCTTEVVDVRAVEEGESPDDAGAYDPGGGWEFEFAIPPGYGKYVAEKGSIALDGISLTVAGRSEDAFTVAIIPTTHELTNFSAKEPGDPVHVEIDVLARYAERLLEDRERAEVPIQDLEREDAGVQLG